MKAPNIDLDPTTVAILAGAAVLAVFLWKSSDNIGKGVSTVYDDAKDAGKGAVDLAGGLLTGNNAITQGGRTNAYEGWGIFGTLGAATDRITGGVLSSTGEWLGGKVFDWTH